MTEQPDKTGQREPDPIKVEVHVTRQSFEPPTLKMSQPGMTAGVCLCDCGSKAGGGSGG
jgi:hypothetical protein